MEESTVLLAELEGGCCPGGIARRISGSLNTCSVFALEGLGILFIDAATTRLLPILISERVGYVLS